jgi:hypothetical protein
MISVLCIKFIHNYCKRRKQSTEPSDNLDTKNPVPPVTNSCKRKSAMLRVRSISEGREVQRPTARLLSLGGKNSPVLMSALSARIVLQSQCKLTYWMIQDVCLNLLASQHKPATPEAS